MSQHFATTSAKLWLIIFILISLLIAGCESDENPDAVTGSQVEGPSSSPQADSSPPTKATEPSADAKLPTSTTGPEQVIETLDLPSLDANQANLDSYHIQIRASFNGENSSGEPVFWIISSRRSITRDPAAERLDITFQGFVDQSDFEEMTLLWTDEESYLIVPSVGCIGRPINGDESEELLKFAYEFVEGLSGAKLESESLVVNETPSRYYRFVHSAQPEWQDSDITLVGHLYIAEDGGYVTRLESVATGSLQFHPQRDTETGIFTLEIDVMEMDDPDSITIPETCSIPSDYPVIEDAFQVTVIDDLVSYRTGQPPPDVLAFYETEMLNNGWSASEEAILLEDSAFLVYEKDGRILTVSLDLDMDEGTVTVLISP